MRKVTIRSGGREFAVVMVEMRRWLDQHMVEPARFTYEQDGENVVISIDFEENEDAEAFQSGFAARQLDANFPGGNADEPLSRAVDDGVGGGRKPLRPWHRLAGGDY